MTNTESEKERLAITTAIEKVVGYGEYLIDACVLVWMTTGKIPAIKLYRTIKSCGLKEAKEAVEEAGHGTLEKIMENNRLVYEMSQPSRSPVFDWLIENSHVCLNGEEWAYRLNITIHDPDGWRRDDSSFTQPIDLLEFIRRASESTIGPGPR
jgi:hypothetical protein